MLSDSHPHVAAQWHPTKNGDLTPDKVTKGSNRQIWWLCADCGREWSTTVKNRTINNSGCRSCVRRKAKEGKSLADLSPHLVDEWHPTKNTSAPDEIYNMSDQKVWWQCVLGHEWEAQVHNRTKPKGSGCPACAPIGVRKLVSGFNDLATLRPDIAKEWHPTKNTLRPSEVPKASRKRVWWLCSFCGREWEAMVKNRTSRNSGCPSCRGRKRSLETSGNNHRQELYVEWSPKNNGSLDHFSVSSSYRPIWVCGNGHEWRATIWDRNHKETGCRRCALNGTSRAEQELFALVQSLVPDAKLHDRSIAPNYEYDISVPSKKIAIEYNGLYWHSEEFKPRNYHKDKSEAAREQGWQVITVWEDDDPAVVQKMLAHKLGASTLPRYNARQLHISNVPSLEATKFLNENHIQGAVGGSVRLGLYTDKPNQLLVALMVFKRRNSKGDYELVRYATSGVVRGGFSKLLAAFKRNNEGKWATIVSFSDRGVSDGGLYTNNGFVQDGEIAPDYTYLYNRKRTHKFNFRKTRFKTDPALKFEEGLTERELAELNDLERIYDAGKVRWICYNECVARYPAPC